MIVTGASRGIGAATARMAAARGYAVAVNYASDAAAAGRVVDEIRNQGGRAIAIQADVSNEKDVVRLFETSDRELGPLKVLVNNAGITGGFARIEEVTADTLSRVFAINVSGAFLCAREAAQDGIVIPLKKGMTPEMIKRIEPPVINPTIIELSKILKDDFSSVTGITDELIGASVQDNSGILEMFRQAAGLVTLRKIFDGADFCLRQCGRS